MIQIRTAIVSLWLILFHSSIVTMKKKNLPLDGVWMPVIGARYKFYVYSAFLDNRVPTRPVVRVVAAVYRNDLDAVVCHVTMRDNVTYDIAAKIEVVREHNQFSYSAAFVLCPLRVLNPYYAVGGTVSITPEISPASVPGNQLNVLDIEPNRRHKNIYHVCVQPMHSGYNYNADRLLEWLELNRLIGVTYFYMYNANITDEVRCLLQEYVNMGLVELKEWNLEISESEMGRPTLQLAALQDCLYRSMASAEYLVVIDTDEFILPRHHYTLKGFLRGLQSAHKSSYNAASYSFRNVFFYTFWPDDPHAVAPILTSKKTLRNDLPLYYTDMSKYIVRPFRAVELGVNQVWQYVDGSMSTYHVSTQDALLHHYRDSCALQNPMYECSRARTQLDRNAHRWANVLMKHIIEQMELISRNCTYN